ncbi:hypothetical protein VP1G_10759 [Cytospora mali]|uniref:Uncharacterized protein n=1 Tax=Cytospora mali TaxID=578113 RepID=A0A194UWY5_CYTMA|nr:hypothetical protein VP1G_10759 [Valsa mali var. pyri (nom. inval.)]
MFKTPPFQTRGIWSPRRNPLPTRLTTWAAWELGNGSTESSGQPPSPDSPSADSDDTNGGGALSLPPRWGPRTAIRPQVPALAPWGAFAKFEVVPASQPSQPSQPSWTSEQASQQASDAEAVDGGPSGADMGSLATLAAFQKEKGAGPMS